MLSGGRLVAVLRRRATVDLGERDEPLRQPADDRERHRQPERARPVRRLGRAADGDPDRQRLLDRPRVDALDLLAQLQQPDELLLEEPVVVGQVVAEQRERLDEGAAADHDLGTAAREQVDRRELLEDADRIVGAEHVDGAREPDPLRPDRGGREDGRRGRDGEVRPVVLPDAEDVEPDLVGELDLLDQVPQPLLGVEPGRQLSEGVDPELHGRIVAVSPRLSDTGGTIDPCVRRSSTSCRRRRRPSSSTSWSSSWRHRPSAPGRSGRSRSGSWRRCTSRSFGTAAFRWRGSRRS